MPHDYLDRQKLRFHALAERRNRVDILRDNVPPDAQPAPLSDEAAALVDETARRLQTARESGAARILAFGAHTIKNGLAPVLIDLIESGWFTHLATNGAGIIHDWEFAFQGQSSEDVRANVEAGAFGLWEETGRYLNLAILVGAHEGLGYGEALGAFVENEGLTVPAEEDLVRIIAAMTGPRPEQAAAAADLLDRVRRFRLAPGRLAVPHPFKQYGLQAAAHRLRVPFTGHPMFGHDIIYAHPMSSGAAIGRTAERDFLAFARAVADLSGGVYVSIGSAVMSPMIFEKSMAMAQNLALQQGRRIHDHFIAVVDLAPSTWDWRQGEPPETSPDYYLRYNKTFARMGGDMRYAQAHNRDVLLALRRALRR